MKEEEDNRKASRIEHLLNIASQDMDWDAIAFYHSLLVRYSWRGLKSSNTEAERNNGSGEPV
jgi:hypothetical protein